MLNLVQKIRCLWGPKAINGQKESLIIQRQPGNRDQFKHISSEPMWDWGNGAAPDDCSRPTRRLQSADDRDTIGRHRTPLAY